MSETHPKNKMPLQSTGNKNGSKTRDRGGREYRAKYGSDGIKLHINEDITHTYSMLKVKFAERYQIMAFFPPPPPPFLPSQIAMSFEKQNKGQNMQMISLQPVIVSSSSSPR